MIAAKTFVDSNILIYAVDRDAESRHELAKQALEELWRDKSGVLSMQVLQEFYNIATRKLASPLSREIARRIVKQYAQWIVPTGAAELASAFAIEDAARIGFWDALIVAAAVKAGAKRILTEDLNHGQTIAGVRIEDPFAT